MRYFLRASLITLIIGLFFVWPLTAKAIDSRCFTKDQCKVARGDQGVEGEGFYDRSDSKLTCGTLMSNDGNTEIPLGFCLPVGQATTKVSFGGKKTFANFGDFIQYGYRYGMWVAGIIAVAFIVISGVQWAASGGNSDMIGSAKNRIAGAITGLILLALSYTVLSTINPYLVQLRLPQAWMINTIGISPPFCSGVIDKNLAYLGPEGKTENQSVKEAAYNQAKSTGYLIRPNPSEIPSGAGAEKSVPMCGHEYLVDGNNTLSCKGDICPIKSDGFKRTCLPFDVTKDNKRENKSTCWTGDLIIHYQVGGVISGLINKLGENLIPGGIEQSDDDYWLQDQSFFSGQEKNYGILPVCQNKNPNFYWITLNSGGTVKAGYESDLPIYKISNTEGFDQFVIQYHRSGTDLKEVLKKMQEQTAINQLCWVPGLTEEFLNDTKIVGFFIQNYININYNSTDGKIYVGLGDSKNEAGGYTIPRLHDSLLYSNKDLPWIEKFIPIEQINSSNGTYLNFTLTGQHIGQMKAALKSW